MYNRLDKVVDTSGGANQIKVRAYNERLVLSLVRRHGNLPKSEIARKTGLSAQTASVIMRSLESEGLLLRGTPQRGKVGQPSVPMSLNPEGVFSIGLKIGRRSAELILVDFLGDRQKAIHKNYHYPLPHEILEFARSGLEELFASLKPEQEKNVAGIGISLPFELWNWAEKVGAPKGEMDLWKDYDFANEFKAITDLPIFIQNDATSACGAELIFGRGSEFSDFVYFFIGTFIGGGIVLNHSIYSGRTGTAGAIGPMPALEKNGDVTQLIDLASIYQLENRLKEKDIDPSPLWLNQNEWLGFEEELESWIGTTARHLAIAIASCCSVIDFEAIIIDGGFPFNVREAIVNKTKAEFEKLDLQGIIEPVILEGVVGSAARALGGASLPLFNRYLLDQNILFKEMS
ncbi:MAG: sugar kinase [Hyphomicrobiales bacterium]|nr:ROK family transcriptional regulator [Hyphomicrobiales bacterium]PCH49778.1 MAG: sugar kinase [Hyphomicrobiales bacterium]